MVFSLEAGFPSRAQVAAAIYETALRSDLCDRFCAVQRALYERAVSNVSGSLNPAREAPDYQSHFARAFEILEQQWFQQGRPGPLSTCPSGSSAWALFAEDGSVLHASDRAQKEVSGKGLTIAGLGLSENAKPTWRQILKRLQSGKFSWRDVLLLDCEGPQRRLLCRPVWIGGEAGTKAALMIETLEVNWGPDARVLLARTFDLSGNDLDVLEDALLGRAQRPLNVVLLNDIAAKTGAPGIAELLRLVTFLLQEYAYDQAISSGESHPPSYNLHWQGGTLEVAQLGAEVGQPVIFVHGMHEGMAPLQSLQPQLRREGFRVFAPYRSGYGGTSPLTSGADPLGTFVDQVEALIEVHSLHNPILVGHNDGAVFARAVAVRLRRKVKAMIAVNASGPCALPVDMKENYGLRKAVAACSLYAKKWLPLVLDIRARQLLRKGAGEVVRCQLSAKNRAAEHLGRNQLDKLLSCSLERMMAQGGTGILSDMRFQDSGWQEQMIGRAPPLVFLTGKGGLDSLDLLVPTPMERSRVQVCISENGGNALFYTSPNLILDALADLSQL